MIEKIKFKNLSLPLKIGFIGGLMFFGYFISFMIIILLIIIFVGI